MSIVPWVRCPVSRRPTAGVTRSTRPRSCTGAAVRIAWGDPVRPPPPRLRRAGDTNGRKREDRDESRGQRQHGKRTEVPVLGPGPHRQREPRVVAESVELERPPHEPPGRRSDGRGVQLRRRVQVPRSRGGEERHRGGDDEVAGLVAGGLRSLRPSAHPHGVAQCGHLPHPRRPWRSGVGHAAFCAPRQLARQREP